MASCDESERSETVEKVDGELNKEDTMNEEPQQDGASSGMRTSKNSPVLKRKIAFLSGAKHEGHLILSITSNGMAVLEGDGSLDSLDITMKYISSLMDGSSDTAQKGLKFLIDCRRNSQAHIIKTVLEKIASEDCPLPCTCVILFKSVSQLNQLTSLFSKNKAKLVTSEIKEKLNIITVKDKEELFRLVPPELLTEDFGGSFHYDHEQWIRNNKLYEKVKILRGKILEKMPHVRDGLNDFEIPQSVKDAERLMTEQLKLKEFFVNMFAEIDVCIDQLTTYLVDQSQDTTLSGASAVAMLSSEHVLAYLNRTNEEVHEEQAEFDKFWALHKARLDHMMRTCHYKRTVEKVKHLVQGHIDDLTRADLAIGENLEVALELGEKHEVFVSTCKEKIDSHMKEIQEEQTQISKLPTGSEIKNQLLLKDINDVKQSVQLLTESYQELMKLCQQKRDLFIVAVKFHMSVRQCEQWCSTVKEFVEVSPLDDVSPDKAGELVEQAESIMQQMTQRQLNSMKEFASCLPEKQVKKLTSKTANKCNSSREKLENYKTKLLQLLALSYAPPAPPPPPMELLDSTDGGGSDSLKSDKVDPASSNPPSWTQDYPDDESDPAVLRKREFVYKEVIQTEKDYINDLKIILDSYYNEMLPEDRVPLRLRGKRSDIFGNLEAIFLFHNEVFLKQLELYENHPERVGSCFIKHSSDFQLYSSYCQNRPKSEALLTESPECQSFFKEIQIRLAHQLPLNSFLIKPIQRITKYQLLIKDMIKYSSKAPQALRDLQTGLSIMLQVLKSLNDSLHVVGLKGFPGALVEQGRLLVHDPFQVWEMGHSRNILSRSHERHVFLFEKVLIFSKKKEEQTQQKHKENKSNSYFYKNHLHLSDVRLKEQPDENPLCFTLLVHGQNRMYKLQANSKDVCVMWTKELHRILCDPFSLLKDVVLKSGTLDRATAAKFTKMSKSVQGKSQLFDGVMPSENSTAYGPKKSFSGRFKLNIRPGKKKSAPNAQERGSGSQTPTPTGSDKEKHQMGYRDDQALFSSVPTKLSARTFSHDDLLSDNSKEAEEWSDGEDESGSPGTADHYEILAPGTAHFYTAVADYAPSGDDQGIPLKIDQEVEVIGINDSGWWWVRATNYVSGETLEGWVPASHLRVSKI
ncbi:PREDICTED: triple functional domain protein-like [Amphimedon queenslandica]|uniref:Uncharacterized protein n=1 Tax=Amphimedon queenslandica TaxID=400682 RepID=A0A1X7U469_AMPQE|nr:PREDICTED: triple functional domain protein-like [Amphimedon queenslandica]|eukprot:XP_019856098.1 PREDICTED: triple functional domain protein-like [Amphimedon queenslandica]